jgi:hypothetical protein
MRCLISSTAGELVSTTLNLLRYVVIDVGISQLFQRLYGLL